MAKPSQDSQITIVVTSANGTQGQAIISALASRNAALPTSYALSVRALVRDPSSPKSQGLLNLSQRNISIVLVQADFNSPETLHAAFIPDADGRVINSVFLNTSPTFNDPQEEVRHATAVLDAAREASVKHIVYTSVLGLTPTLHPHLTHLPSWLSPSTLPSLLPADIPPTEHPRHKSNLLLNLPSSLPTRQILQGYFGAKAEIEYRVKNWGSTWSILRPGWFMTNFLPPSSANYFPELGTSHPVLRSAISKASRMMLVDPRDIGDIGAQALLGNEGLVGRVVNVGSQALGLEEIARVLGRAAGVRVGVEFVGEEEAEREVREGNVQREAQAWHAELQDCMEPGGLERVLGRAPRTLEEFLRDWDGGVVRLSV